VAQQSNEAGSVNPSRILEGFFFWAWPAFHQENRPGDLIQLAVPDAPSNAAKKEKTMFTGIQLQRRSVRSQPIATNVFERASLSILRRHQRAATRSAGIEQDATSTAPDKRKCQQDAMPPQQ